ncbi:MAG: hypothetical protein LLF76_07120 [Planctomycetaceae bacterium]|nr:hypothetical protein [Planctomycetaceae bacterium]
MAKNRFTGFHIMYSVISLFILTGFTIGAFSEHDFTMILGAILFICIQWGLYFLIKSAVCFLKRRYPKQWSIVLSVWIACTVFLLFAFFLYIAACDEGYISTQFMIMACSVGAILGAVVYSIKSKNI